MDATRWQQVRAAFDAIVDQPVERRAHLLDALGLTDAGLRHEVEALLMADAQTGRRDTSLAGQAPELLDDLGDGIEQQTPDRWLEQRLGPWRLLECIGRGGMGRVYLAERDDGQFRQRVALKLVGHGADHDEVVRRFRAERQILAGLQHPNIAALIDGGVSLEGVPWFAMEYVDGAPITAWCDAGKATIEQRLHTFLSVCAAVSHAHEWLVIHRDLKPGNILVNAEGQVKLLDFGIAKLLDGDAGGSRTGTAAHLFTPEYAAPEQVRSELPTTAVDVYALGCLLYELLTGCGPYREFGPGAAALAQAVLTREPRRPSATSLWAGRKTSGDPISTRAARRGLSAQRLRLKLRGDLDAIVLKALRKEPERRYASVRELAQDIQATLERRPVAARQGSRRYHLQRFVRRNAIAVTAAAAVFIALVGGMAMALWQAKEAGIQRDLAQTEVRKAEQVMEFLFGIFEGTHPSQRQDGDVTARTLLDRASGRITEDLDEHPEVRAALLEAMARAYTGLGLPGEALPLSTQALDLRRELGDPQQLARGLIRHTVNLQNQTRWHEVLPVLAEAERLLDPGMPDIELLRAEIDERTGLVLMAIDGDPDEAELRFLRAGAAYRELLAPDHDRTVQAMMGLSRVLAAQQRHAEATALFEPIVERLREAGPERAGMLLGVLDTQGQLLFRQERWQETERVREETLELAERIHGPDAWRTLIASNNLGVVRSRQHRFQDALAPLQRAVAGAEAILPEDHAFTVAARFNLAEVEAGLERWPQALQRFQSVQDYLDRHPDMNRPDRDQVREQVQRCRRALALDAQPALAAPGS